MRLARKVNLWGMMIGFFVVSLRIKSAFMKRILTTFIALVTMVVTSVGFTRIEGSLTESAIYPGTCHEYIVTVGEAYQPGSPAGLYIGLDGILCDAPAVMDSLTAEGVMPPMIGVFIQPGKIVDGEGNVVRYNRSNEFDAITDCFASFLETELLPEIAGLTTEDGRKIVIPSKPEWRCIMGLSSGGIAAFNAAFRRPDLIGKVFSGCGTFVPMRGGEQLQALVRKTEPGRIRVYLQDGYEDTWNPLFGSWFEANTLLNSALEFAGYDVAHDWAEGGHSVKRATEIFPEVMKWMWRDYPANISVPTSGNTTLQRYLTDEREWEAWDEVVIRQGNRQAVYPDSTFVVSTIEGSNRLAQSIIDRRNGELIYTQPFYYLHSLSGDAVEVRDMGFDADGNLWVLTTDGLQICDQNGRVRAILRFPNGFDAATMDIMADGTVALTSASGKVVKRRFNVAPAQPGVRPKSQGQA